MDCFQEKELERQRKPVSMQGEAEADGNPASPTNKNTPEDSGVFLFYAGFEPCCPLDNFAGLPLAARSADLVQMPAMAERRQGNKVVATYAIFLLSYILDKN